MNNIFFKAAWKILGRKELHIDKDLCIRCGKCAKICTHDAVIQNDDKSYDINHDKCHRCNHCLENCPKTAIV
ncbi:MAG: 4Fe-4S binding protein [Lachnospiraceae bacterium]|nr:4Fe-4S binding protein [Lachnospiraceae bacterium]